MTKKEASELLGVSIKALEKYMAQKRLAYSHVQGKYGKEVRFEAGEIERFGRELAAKKEKIFHPAIESGNEVVEISQTDSNVSVFPKQESLTLAVGRVGNSTDELVRILKEAINKASDEKKELSISDLASKLTLNLIEASRLAGLSINYLKAAIKSGELKAGKRGKGWNIKRENLEIWVKGL